jgi:hypothetical protein
VFGFSSAAFTPGVISLIPWNRWSDKDRRNEAMASKKCLPDALTGLRDCSFAVTESVAHAIGKDPSLMIVFRECVK